MQCSKIVLFPMFNSEAVWLPTSAHRRFQGGVKMESFEPVGDARLTRVTESGRSRKVFAHENGGASAMDGLCAERAMCWSFVDLGNAC